MKQSVRILMFVSVVVLAMAGCKKVIKHEQHGWAITADPKTSTISITKNGLDKVADQIHLNLKKENKIILLSGWTISKKNGELLSQTLKSPIF